MNGITYYKLQSPYFGDVTKNCSLNGLEVDQNFFTLEGRDVKSITVEKEHIVISFVNGESINTSLESTLATVYEFDKTNGVLKITRNGVTQEIGGFLTLDAIKEVVKNVGLVYVDGTLKGNGKPYSPIGISSTYKTGAYKPVERLIDLCNNESLPLANEVKNGDRFLTYEKHSTLGLLYNYEGVKHIACDLACASNGWRIPTKEDWDDMMNAVEVDETCKNHNLVMSNKLLGCVAGKILKSTDMWKEYAADDVNNQCNCNTTNNINTQIQSCNEPFYGEVGKTQCSCNASSTQGINKYGFNVIPVGYADDTKQYQYYKERTWYWTATNQEYTNAFTKRFTYNTNKVYQDVTPTDFYLSLRLIKDFDGTNHIECEEILGGVYPTVLMPSTKNGSAIWTAINIDLTNSDYKGLMPNVNDESVLVNKYYINEWNGKKWVRNELKEGETVVIKHSDNGDDCVEYRVINGIIVNTSSILYNEVVNSIKDDFERIETLIKEESERALESEKKLQTEIDSTTVLVVENENKIQSLTDEVVVIRENVETTISNLNVISEKIDKEIERAIASEEELHTSIIDIEQQFSNRIDEEITAVTENLNNKTAELNSKISEVNETLPIQEGTVFDSKTGVLTIKSGNETNDINVQFSFNFGEI